MSWRNKNSHRCEKCRLRQELCICSLIPQFSLDTKVIILIHNRETKRTSNTGRLAHLMLPNSEMRIRGLIEKPLETEDFADPARQALLLYPSVDATELSREYIEKIKKPVTLIVPDGSWRQAGKMPQRVPNLESVPRVKVPPGRPTEYRLRLESKPEGLATFEAIARALGIIENPQVQLKMESVFKIMVERTLWARAKISARECTGGIPREAIG